MCCLGLGLRVRFQRSYLAPGCGRDLMLMARGCGVRDWAAAQAFCFRLWQPCTQLQRESPTHTHCSMLFGTRCTRAACCIAVS